MAELVIHLQIDPETGKKNLIIEYESDSDMLPHEHEEEHRRLLDQIVEGKLKKFYAERGVLWNEEEGGEDTVEPEGSDNPGEKNEG